MNRKEIDKRVEDTLSSLQGCVRVTPGPYIYEKTLTRMEQMKRRTEAPRYVLWGAVSTITAILVLNLFAWGHLYKMEKAVEKAAQVAMYSKYFNETTIIDY